MSEEPENEVRIVLDKALPPFGVAELYRSAKWVEPTQNGAEDGVPAFIAPMLENSFAAAGAFVGEKLVGFARTLSDGVSDAYILDVVVHPDFRRRGIAKKMVALLKEKLLSCGVDWIVCISVPGAEKVYTDENGGKVMKDHVPIRLA